MINTGFPGGSVVKNPPGKAGDTGDAGLIPESGKSFGVVNDNPLQYSFLKNSIDRGAWRATVHRVAKSWIQLHARMHVHDDYILFFMNYLTEV